MNPELQSALQTLAQTPIGQIFEALKHLRDQQNQQDQQDQNSSNMNHLDLPPPMAAGVLSDAIGQALIESGNSDLVVSGTTPDGSTFNSIGPNLLNPAAEFLWVVGWPVWFRDSAGLDKQGAPVFFCPPDSVLEDAVRASLSAAGGVSTRTDLGQICAAKLRAAGYGDVPR